jgi:hypothetical protein
VALWEAEEATMFMMDLVPSFGVRPSQRAKHRVLYSNKVRKRQEFKE